MKNALKELWVALAESAFASMLECGQNYDKRYERWQENLKKIREFSDGES